MHFSCPDRALPRPPLAKKGRLLPIGKGILNKSKTKERQRQPPKLSTGRCALRGSSVLTPAGDSHPRCLRAAARARPGTRMWMMPRAPTGTFRGNGNFGQHGGGTQGPSCDKQAQPRHSKARAPLVLCRRVSSVPGCLQRCPECHLRRSHDLGGSGGAEVQEGSAGRIRVP